MSSPRCSLLPLILAHLFTLFLVLGTMPSNARAKKTDSEKSTDANSKTEEKKDQKQDKDKDEKDEKNKEEKAKDDKSKLEIRNNAASLLFDLLGDEKNLSKILILHHGSAPLEKLVKSISKSADKDSKQLEELAKTDSSLDLHALDLPPGETAARKAISKTQEHDLIFSSGEKFELRLLLTQTDALNYGSHLAKVASENSPAEGVSKEFHSLDVELNSLYDQTVAQLRAVPAK